MNVNRKNGKSANKADLSWNRLFGILRNVDLTSPMNFDHIAPHLSVPNTGESVEEALFEVERSRVEAERLRVKLSMS
jgi:hypothetical protein